MFTFHWSRHTAMYQTTCTTSSTEYITCCSSFLLFLSDNYSKKNFHSTVYLFTDAKKYST